MQIGFQDQTSQTTHELYLYIPQRSSALAVTLTTTGGRNVVRNGIKEYNMIAKTCYQGSIIATSLQPLWPSFIWKTWAKLAENNQFDKIKWSQKKIHSQHKYDKQYIKLEHQIIKFLIAKRNVQGKSTNYHMCIQKEM